MDALEAALRSHVKAAVHRGHLELTLSLEKASAATAVELDESLLDAYVRSFERAADASGSPSPSTSTPSCACPASSRPPSLPRTSATCKHAALQALAELLTRFNEARSAEGAALAADLRAGMQSLATLTEEARALREGVTAAEFTRLTLKLQDLLGNTDRSLRTNSSPKPPSSPPAATSTKSSSASAPTSTASPPSSPPAARSAASSTSSSRR